MAINCKRVFGVLMMALAPGLALATLVRFDTAKGPIDINLYDAEVPLTVANFLSYVRQGDYTNTFFHRSVSLAVGGIGIIQGGGFTWNSAASPMLASIPAKPAIVLEASSQRLNARGTIAMARTAVQNSATSQWFINYADNSTSLGVANGGGYAVFGRVTPPSMVTVDGVAALPTQDVSRCAGYGAFAGLPLLSRITLCSEVSRTTLSMVNAARVLPAAATLTATERVLNYLEAAYPQYVQPASPPQLIGLGYDYRYYEKTNAYVGTKDGNVYYLVPAISPDITLLGPLADWLAVAVAAGY